MSILVLHYATIIKWLLPCCLQRSMWKPLKNFRERERVPFSIPQTPSQPTPGPLLWHSISDSYLCPQYCAVGSTPFLHCEGQHFLEGEIPTHIWIHHEEAVRFPGQYLVPEMIQPACCPKGCVLLKVSKTVIKMKNYLIAPFKNKITRSIFKY